MEHQSTTTPQGHQLQLQQPPRLQQQPQRQRPHHQHHSKVRWQQSQNSHCTSCIIEDAACNLACHNVYHWVIEGVGVKISLRVHHDHLSASWGLLSLFYCRFLVVSSGFFWLFGSKLKATKTQFFQNSSKIFPKLKQNSPKTQFFGNSLFPGVKWSHEMPKKAMLFRLLNQNLQLCVPFIASKIKTQDKLTKTQQNTSETKAIFGSKLF